MKFGGVVVEPGELVLVSLLAANRDDDLAADAGMFRPERPPKQHVAFGHGIHYCLGAPLARLEGEVALGALLRRFPALRFAVPPSELTWKQSVFVRGLATLPVSVAP